MISQAIARPLMRVFYGCLILGVRNPLQSGLYRRHQPAVCLITLAANDESVHVVGVVIPFSTPLPFNSLAFAD
jgi:hypothetical protein